MAIVWDISGMKTSTTFVIYFFFYYNWIVKINFFKIFLLNLIKLQSK